jgi:hypothetical protein
MGQKEKSEDDKDRGKFRKFRSRRRPEVVRGQFVGGSMRPSPPTDPRARAASPALFGCGRAARAPGEFFIRTSCRSTGIGFPVQTLRGIAPPLRCGRNELPAAFAGQTA